MAMGWLEVWAIRALYSLNIFNLTSMASYMNTQLWKTIGLLNGTFELYSIALSFKERRRRVAEAYTWTQICKILALSVVFLALVPVFYMYFCSPGSLHQRHLGRTLELWFVGGECLKLGPGSSNCLEVVRQIPSTQGQNTDATDPFRVLCGVLPGAEQITFSLGSDSRSKLRSQCTREQLSPTYAAPTA